MLLFGLQTPLLTLFKGQHFSIIFSNSCKSIQFISSCPLTFQFIPIFTISYITICLSSISSTQYWAFHWQGHISVAYVSTMPSWAIKSRHSLDAHWYLRCTLALSRTTSNWMLVLFASVFQKLHMSVRIHRDRIIAGDGMPVLHKLNYMMLLTRVSPLNSPFGSNCFTSQTAYSVFHRPLTWSENIGNVLVPIWL